MDDTNRRPVLLLAFANDRDDRAKHLRNLAEELRRIRERLDTPNARELCEVVVRANTTADELLDVFQDVRYRDRIAVFHYGGHAGGQALLLETFDGKPSPAWAVGLAQFLGKSRNLQLVFLNGCSTEPQVEGLIDAGIPAVIATADSIRDDVATDFAARFYTALAGGATIDTAYSEAVAAVRTTRGGRTHDVERVDVETANRWPWALHVRPGGDIVRSWCLPAAADNPLFGLPTPPERDLPDTPFRHLDWFREEDAELFFGRGREIRALYERVTAASTPPILLLYGQSGVGKSSLLSAGVVPRLRPNHEVRYTRRSREQGLTGTLAAALETREDGPAIVEAWHAVENVSARPLIVILDQVEEVFTRPTADHGDELPHFLDTLAELFEDRSRRPRGRLILSFRKEWLAEIEDRLRERRVLPRSKVFLDRLSRGGIIEIVEGPTRSPRLATHFRLSIEPAGNVAGPRLSELVADDVLADPGTAAAAPLQILLTKMWARAVKLGPERPCFGVPLYREIWRRGMLAEFVDEQLAALRASFADASAAGLPLDLLAFHTTPLGTAEQRTARELTAAYAHQARVLPDLVRRATDLHLLTSVEAHEGDGRHGGRERPVTRLAHDTLAPIVRYQFEESDRPGQRARRILESKAAAWQEGNLGDTLDGPDLQTVEAGCAGMRVWTPDESRLVAASRRRRQRRSWALGVTAAAGVAAVGIIVGLYFAARSSEREALAQGAASLSRALAAASNAETQADVALVVAVEATHASRTHEARSALLSSLLRPRPQPMRVLAGHEDSVTAVAFSPDSTKLASADDEGTVRLWNVASREAITEFVDLESTVTTLAFAPDGAVLAAGAADGALHMWDVGLDQSIGKSLSGQEDRVTALAFAPDGATLASAGDDGTVRLWNVRTGEVIGRLRSKDMQPVLDMAFSADGMTLTFADGDGGVRRWNARARTMPTEVLVRDNREVESAAFSLDGATLAFLGSNGTVWLWDLRTVQPIEASPRVGHEDDVDSIALSPDGAILASVGGRTVVIWDVRYNEVIGTPVPSQMGDYVSLAFSPNGNMLASSGGDGLVRLWNMNTRPSVIAPLLSHQDGVNSVAFSTDGTVVAGSTGRVVQLWDVRTRQSMGTPLAGHQDHVAGVAFSPDGTTLASASHDRSLRLWDRRTHQPIGAPLLGHQDHATSVAFSPDGAMLASGGKDATVRFWDVRTRQPVGAPLRVEGPIGFEMPVAFSPVGATLASANYLALRLWDVRTLAPVGVPILGHNGNVFSLAFSPDGTFLASASGDGTVRLWDTRTREPLGAPLEGHDNSVLSVAFSPDGTVLASTGWGGDIRLWDLQTRRTIGAPLDSLRVTGSLAFSPDGATLASGAIDGLRLWDVSLNAWQAHACAAAGRNLPLEVWDRLLPGRAYKCTCPSLPPGEGVQACPASGER